MLTFSAFEGIRGERQGEYKRSFKSARDRIWKSRFNSGSSSSNVNTRLCLYSLSLHSLCLEAVAASSVNLLSLVLTTVFNEGEASVNFLLLRSCTRPSLALLFSDSPAVSLSRGLGLRGSSLDVLDSLSSQKSSLMFGGFADRELSREKEQE